MKSNQIDKHKLFRKLNIIPISVNISTSKETIVKALKITISALLLCACAQTPKRPLVRQADLDAWKGQPVEKLDTHPLFVQIPMKKVVSKDGTETRFYINATKKESCSQSGAAHRFSSSTPVITKASTNCVEESISCNNVFKIKDDIVVSYLPKGQCYTDDSVRPE